VLLSPAGAQQHGVRAAIDRRYLLQTPALSSKPAVAAVDRLDEQQDGRPTIT